MDSLHLFTIPKWLPNNILPPELWAIIFCWKWRLEMKSINRRFNGILKVKHYMVRRKMCRFSFEYTITGNNLISASRKDIMKVYNKKKKYGNWINIVPKCGIEFLHHKWRLSRSSQGEPPCFWVLDGQNDTWNRSTHEELYNHIQDNLGIELLKNICWNDMIKLLRTV
jgi:hypothetical protein